MKQPGRRNIGFLRPGFLQGLMIGPVVSKRITETSIYRRAFPPAIDADSVLYHRFQDQAVHFDPLRDEDTGPLRQMFHILYG